MIWEFDMRNIIAALIFSTFVSLLALASQNTDQPFHSYSCTLFVEKGGERISNKSSSFNVGHDAGTSIELGSVKAIISYAEDRLILQMEDSNFTPKLYSYSHFSLQDKVSRLHIGDGNYNGYTLECLGQ
jgi:hypothetical protein